MARDRMNGNRTDRSGAHVEPPEISGDRLHSGQRSALIVHAGEHASIGEGDDGSLWILVLDPERRPRGRDPGVVIDSDAISFEQNGLVRVLNRRLSNDTIERLVADLTGRSASISNPLAMSSRIPAGNYAGVVVEPIDGHYRVRADGSAAQRFSELQQLGQNRWLVLAGEESDLRRELVRQLMPMHHRAAWSVVKHGSWSILAAMGLLSGLTVLVPGVIVIAVPAIGALGLLYWRKKSIVAWARRRWVEPCITRTYSEARDR